MRTNIDNKIDLTDSYKLGHWNMYPRDTEGVYSYFESRPGAAFPYTVFFGLQYILKRYLVGSVVSWDDLDQAMGLARDHFGNNTSFNYGGWAHIMEEHGGKLPLRIKAVPEGTPVPTGNVLMTVENTDPKCFWLTNAVESLLVHAWYPSTVATLSRSTIQDVLRPLLEDTADSLEALPHMLHDFGFRGATGVEAACIGGLAHLVNSLGTDTVPALLFAQEYYGAEGAVGHSVAATEHSVMTALGEEGEFVIVERLLEQYPAGILSVVGDSYDIYRFVERIGSLYRAQIMQRDGVWVTRPDSPTPTHPDPSALVVWILEQHWRDFGGEVNAKGYRVLDPHIRVLWGDGLQPSSLKRILVAARDAGFSAENLVFGMGGGLLQKIDRDTQRFAFKMSAIKRQGLWHPTSKRPLDVSKASKRGRLALIEDLDGFHTVPEDGGTGDLLETVFENGKLLRDWTFDEVRDRARPAERVGVEPTGLT